MFIDVVNSPASDTIKPGDITQNIKLGCRREVALREILDTFNLPENAARLEDARISAGNDMLKSMQHVFPAATQMQVQVIHRYGFLPDGEGLVQFTKAVRLYEEHDQEVRQLNEQLRSVLIPPVNVPYPVSPVASQNGVS